MKYEITHSGNVETHRVELQKMELILGVEHLNKELYTRYRTSKRTSEKLLALALIAKAIEDTPETHDPDYETEQSEHGTDFKPDGE